VSAARDSLGRRPRLFDWRFLVALTVLLLVATSLSDYVAKGRRLDQLVTQLRHARSDDATARANADRQRDQLLANQARVLDQLDDVTAQLHQLRRYLVSQGVTLPAELGDDRGGRAAAPSSALADSPSRHDKRSQVGQAKPVPTGSPAHDTSPSTSPPDETPAPPVPAPPPRGPLAGLLGQLDGLLTPREATP
jgi:hypothetical protein